MCWHTNLHGTMRWRTDARRQMRWRTGARRQMRWRPNAQRQMHWRTNARGQASVEAAFAIPVIFTLLLLLLQPGIILYDRMVMRQAAAEGCRLLATRSAQAGLSDERCIELIKRQLSAVPPHDLFHIHSAGCSWNIVVSGDESSGEAQVKITNRLRLLPLFDAAGALVGIADASGCISIQVEEQAQTQPSWVGAGNMGLNPGSWVQARKGS